MRYLLIYTVILLLFPIGSCNSQSINQIDDDFHRLNQHFIENDYMEDPLVLPLIHKNDRYSVEFEKKSLNLTEKEIQLSNPYSGGHFPLAFSLIFNDNLVTLFDNGKFACHRINKFERNLELEAKLNKRNFDYAWIIGGTLIAKYNYDYFQLDSNLIWIEYKKPVPFCQKNLPFNCRPKLFEDEEYLVYQECRGEFGGLVYFYNKQTKKTFQTVATCSNSILKIQNKYHVLSHLGHGVGTSDLQIITDPTKLKVTSTVPKLFDYWQLQTFTSFTLQDKTVYLVYWRNATFLATYSNNSFKIVDPLFNNDLYTHDPVTTVYNKDLILINLDFYGRGRYREVACILINGNNLTQVNWEEK